MSARRRWGAAVLAGWLALAGGLPGCRATGELATDVYDVTAAAMVPNPAAIGVYYGGLGLGFLASSPLLLLSWPLTWACYPDDDSDAYYYQAALGPSWLVGSLLGAGLALPFYPFGWPWVPDDPLVETRGRIR